MRGAAGGTGVNVAVNNVGGHNSIQTLLADQRAEHGHIFRANFRFRTRIARRLFVRVCRHRPMPWEVLAGGFHTRAVHAIDEMASYRQRLVGVLMIRTLANSGADMSDIQHRRKADINIHSDHFAGHQPTGFCGQPAALFHA